jgi:hypothetical protein
LLAALLIAVGCALASMGRVYKSREPTLSPRVISFWLAMFGAITTFLAALSYAWIVYTTPLAFQSIDRGLLLSIAVSALACLCTTFTMEWLGIISHAATKLLQQVSGKRPFKAWKQVLITALPILLGPIGGLFSAAYCRQVFKDFETLALARQAKS